MMRMGPDRRGFVWYELLLVVMLVAAFAVFVIPRFQRAREREKVVKVQEVLKTIHQKQRQFLRESGRYGEYQEIRMKDMGFVTRPFDLAVEHVSESTYVAIATEKREPYRFLSIDQDSSWAGNLAVEEE